MDSPTSGHEPIVISPIGPAVAEGLGTPFRALFDRELPYVWTSLGRLGVPERDREDLANEVFFRVHRRLPEYDPARPLRPWLFAFVVRVASEHVAWGATDSKASARNKTLRRSPSARRATARKLANS